jgi:hypothetical protein
MRIIGNVPRFGHGQGDRFNQVKGKVLLCLVTNQSQWVTAIQLANSTGLNRKSLFILLKRWCGPPWHLTQRRMSNNFYRYHISNNGVAYFERWAFLMPIKNWQQEIQQWQSEKRKMKEAESPGGTWYQDEAGQWRFKNNT